MEWQTNEMFRRNYSGLLLETPDPPIIPTPEPLEPRPDPEPGLPPDPEPISPLDPEPIPNGPEPTDNLPLDGYVYQQGTVWAKVAWDSPRLWLTQPSQKVRILG